MASVRTKAAVIAGCLAIGGLCAAAFVPKSNKAIDVSASVSADRGAAVSATEFARVRARLNTLEALQRSRTQDRVGAAPVEADAGLFVEETAYQPVTESEHIAKQLAHLDGTLQHEPRDNGWASEVEGLTITTLLEPAFESTKLLSVKCAATVCRIEVEHDNQDVQLGFHEQFAMTSVGRQGAGAWSSRSEVGGRFRTLYYIARQGHGHLLNGPPTKAKGAIE